MIGLNVVCSLTTTECIFRVVQESSFDIRLHCVLHDQDVEMKRDADGGIYWMQLIKLKRRE